MPDLEALKPFTYATRRLMAGDTFEASRNDARLLIGLKRARRRDPKQPDLPLSGGGGRAPRGDPPDPPDPVAPADPEPGDAENDLPWGEDDPADAPQVDSKGKPKRKGRAK